MAYEEKENSGSLFVNSHKEKDTHPDFTGRGNFNGVSFEISAWKKPGKNGKPVFLSLSIKPPFQREEQQPRDRADEDPFDSF